jgi:hypothetical protein
VKVITGFKSRQSAQQIIITQYSALWIEAEVREGERADEGAGKGMNTDWSNATQHYNDRTAGTGTAGIRRRTD